MERLRDGFERRVLERDPRGAGERRRAHPGCRTPATSASPAADGEALLIALDLEGFSVSLGAACASGTMRPSPVLLAMGSDHDEARSSLRISLGPETSEADVEALVRALERLLPQVSHHEPVRA